MKTYIVSDLHIDDGTGKFSKHRDTFLSFLDTVGDNDLLITGDCVDLWRWSAKDILNGLNKPVIDALIKKKNVKLALGNHDLDLTVMRSIFQGVDDIAMSFVIDGWLAIHGHQGDSRLDHPRERKLVKEISLLIQKIDSKLLNRFRDWASSGPRSNAEYKTKFQGVKLIMGHSHVREIRTSYLNSGTWTGDECPSIIIENGYTPQLLLVR
jgi:UDP-2,3-diacylglucosamine pyrophosphatase LpxH